VAKITFATDENVNFSISSAAYLNLFGFLVLFQIIEAELDRLEKEHPDCISANTILKAEGQT
jgi:hypothetical protein